VYRGEIADIRGQWAPGDAVDVLDAAGHALGRGLYNPRTGIACRLLARADEVVDGALLRRRLAAALDYRRAAGLVVEAYRLCWSEADGLPGLVVDRYRGVSVVQCLTLGMARLAGLVTEGLTGLFPGEPVYRADDPTAARVEGFEPQRGWVAPSPSQGEGQGEGFRELIVAAGACRFAVTLGTGQKTGLYLDQRENHLLVAAHAGGRRVLDAFAYTGGFACHTLRAGATEAVMIESSPEALEGARRNLDLNGVGDRATVRAANAFDELRALAAQRERFGLVVLDPPPFTRRKDTVDAAARGYKEINLRGLRLLEPGGILATFSCSHHVTPEMFGSVCRAAAGDAGIPARVVATLGQARDHPVLLAVPETRYLTGLLLQAV
jgi:23S rRNA (cytosine1962-C5)-methyltransferase